MEGHLLKQKLVRSKKWRRLSEGTDFERLTYTLLVACVDSWGMMPADGPALKYTLYRYTEHTPDQCEEAVKALVRSGLVASWTHQDDAWLYVVGHDEEQKRGIKKRKPRPDVPRPDWVIDWQGEPGRGQDAPRTRAGRG